MVKKKTLWQKDRIHPSKKKTDLTLLPITTKINPAMLKLLIKNRKKIG